MKVKITKGAQSHLFDASNLEEICLELAGGGFTSTQTMKAMTMRAQLQRGEAVVTRQFKVELVEG